MIIRQKKLLIATHNQGKVRELSEFLAGLPITLYSLSQFPDVVEIDETGSSFEENARLKAAGYATLTGIASIADDSGLEVEALGDRPGVLSARYGGIDLPFAEKMDLLLAEIEESGDTERRARFVCSMAIADIDGHIISTSTGTCVGIIAFAARGSGGFGYDPLFIPNGYEFTFGELPTDIKRKISHRFRAFEQIFPFLGDFIAI